MRLSRVAAAGPRNNGYWVQRRWAGRIQVPIACQQTQARASFTPSASAGSELSASHAIWVNCSWFNVALVASLGRVLARHARLSVGSDRA